MALQQSTISIKVKRVSDTEFVMTSNIDGLLAILSGAYDVADETLFSDCAALEDGEELVVELKEL